MFSSSLLTSIVNSHNPRCLISNELWRFWTDTLRSSKQTFIINELASEMGIKLSKPRYESLFDYLDYNIEELISIDSPEKDMGLIVFKCVAYAAIELGFQGYTFEELIAQTLNTLKEKEKLVLHYRYGLAGNRRHTLEEIGKSFGVTRERIRQIENKAKRRLRHPSRSKRIKEALKRNEKVIWDSVCNDIGIVYKSVAQKHLLNRFSGEFELAIECCFNSIAKWFSAISNETSSAWYRSQFSESAISECLMKLDNAIYPLPLPLSSLSRFMETDSKLLELAIGLSENMKVLDGYIVKSPAGPKVRRCINLHRILAGYGFKKRLSRDDLTDEHNAIFKKEVCSVHDAEIVMEANTHLFLRMGNIGWCSIGPCGSQIGLYDDNDNNLSIAWFGESEADEDGPVNKPAGGIKVHLKKILREKGPCKYSDLVNYMGESKSSQYEAHGVPYVLRDYSDFMLLAPGIWGLSYDTTKASSLLLNERSCRHYIFARYAGEPIKFYPLWTYEMERRWCLWAEMNCYSSLFKSLLSVSQPSNWNCSNIEKEHWVTKKYRLGHYLLRSNLDFIELRSLPSIMNIISVAEVTREIGRMSWILANRLISHRLDFGKGISALAIMIALGAVEPANDYQQSHFRGHELDGMVTRLLDERHKSGHFTWKSAFGDNLRERIVDFFGANNPGWLKRAHFTGLFEAFEFDETQPMFGDLMDLGSDPEETSELDDVLESLRKIKKTTKLNEIMTSLMEED